MNFDENDRFIVGFTTFQGPRGEHHKPSPGAGRARGGSSLSGEVGVLRW